MKKILVCTPTYNEAKNIEKFCSRIFKIKYKIDLLVIDDNSPDGTSLIIKKLKKKMKNLILIQRAGKLGIGSALRMGIKYAKTKNYSALITLDADLSHQPEEIPKFLLKLKKNNYDFIIGSRYIKGGKSDYSGFRDLVSKLGNKLCRIILDMPFNEFTTSYRLYNRKCIKTLNQLSFESNDYSSLIELFFYIYYSGLKCCEVPIHFKDRFGGESKIPKLQIIYGFIKLIQLFFKKKVIKNKNKKKWVLN